jgi:integrase
MATQSRPFRVGRVTVYPRGRVWYLRYQELGRRRQIRGGLDRQQCRQRAAAINAQLESGTPTPAAFAPITVAQLRQQWLDHHEHILRSSVATIDRYRTATDHLMLFIQAQQLRGGAAQFNERQAEEFARHLRQVKVAPNGHRNSARRHLRDKGVIYILQVCRSLFNFAQRRRHLPPYADNPFSAIRIGRIPIEDSKPVVLMTADQERAFFNACDDWQLPLFGILLLTGLRPGELTHLLLPDDLDLDQGWLMVRNKPMLGWQVKTRNQRRIPLVPEAAQLLRCVIGSRHSGPVFLRRMLLAQGGQSRWAMQSPAALEAEVQRRAESVASQAGQAFTRAQRRTICRRLWVEMGAVKEDRLRNEFMDLTRRIGAAELTAPKLLRHTFATILQEGRVDPLIRNQLMGHVPADQHRSKGPLAMTAVYSHAGPETVRRQLTEALQDRPALQAIRRWLAAHLSEGSLPSPSPLSSPPAAAGSAAAHGTPGVPLDGSSRSGGLDGCS